jgi:hypothetical protein
MSRYLELLKREKSELSEQRQAREEDSSLNSLNSQAKTLQKEPVSAAKGAGVEPIAWEGDIPIYVYPGETCVRCNRLPAVGTPECPRWCQVCYRRDQEFWKAFYAGKPPPVRPPITYERPRSPT